MKIMVTLTQRAGVAAATAEYSGKIITVLAGGKISPDFANHIRDRKTAKAYRDNPEYVDKNGNILNNCEFTSPSTAAQFVTGEVQVGMRLGKLKRNLILVNI